MMDRHPDGPDPCVVVDLDRVARTHARGNRGEAAARSALHAERDAAQLAADLHALGRDDAAMRRVREALGWIW